MSHRWSAGDKHLRQGPNQGLHLECHKVVVVIGRGVLLRMAVLGVMPMQWAF